MKKIITFVTVFVFSMVFISCSADSGSKPDSATNSNTASTKPVGAQPSPTIDEKKPAGKSDADRMDGKSDADRSNSNR